MKLLTFNIYQGGRDKVGEILQFLTDVKPDLLCINEACNWQNNEHDLRLLHAFQLTPDHMIYCHANSGRSSANRVYDIILLSKFPILAHHLLTDPDHIWHGMIIAKIDTPLGVMQVVATHLSSNSVAWRMKELRALFEGGHFDPALPTILMGDLNLLSHHDPYTNLDEKLKEQGISKFDNPPVFDEMRYIEKHGFINHHAFEPTVLEDSADPDHLDLRLDYILTKGIAPKHIKKAHIINTPQTRIFSDHFPVGITLGIKK